MDRQAEKGEIRDRLEIRSHEASPFFPGRSVLDRRIEARDGDADSSAGMPIIKIITACIYFLGQDYQHHATIIPQLHLSCNCCLVSGL